jgi:hypothetical protein
MATLIEAARHFERADWSFQRGTRLLAAVIDAITVAQRPRATSARKKLEVRR